MSALADQVLVQLEQQALAAGLPLDDFDEHIAHSLQVPSAALYAYLRVCFAAERWQLVQGQQLQLDGMACTATVPLFGGDSP